MSRGGHLMTQPNSPVATKRLSRSIFVFSFAAAFVFLYLRTFLLPCTPFIVFSDQVLFFSRAVRVLHGEVPYRDFFDFVTPGIHLLYAAAFRVFGVHAWVIQAWGIVLGLALAYLLTRIASRILHGPVVLLPGLLFLALDLNYSLSLTHHWYSTLASLAAVEILMDGIEPWRVSIAGALCAISTLITQTQGTLSIIALVLYFVWLRRSGAQYFSLSRRLAALLVPFVLILSATLGYYSYQAGFRRLFFDLVIFPIRFQSSGEHNSPRAYLNELPPVHSLFAIPHLLQYLFIHALVPYIYFVGLYQLHRKRNQLPPLLRQRLVLIHLVGLGLSIAVATGPSLFRLSTVAPPAILIFTWLLSQPDPAPRVARNLICVFAIIMGLAQSFRNQTHWHATLDLPIGRTAFTDVLSFRQFQWLAQRTHPNDLFFNDSALCLYLSLRNPTPTEFINYDDYTRPDQVSAVIQALQRHPAKFIILIPRSGLPLNSSDPSYPHDHSAPFLQYVHDKYRLAQVFPLKGAISYQEELWELKSTPDSSDRPELNLPAPTLPSSR